jgi:hypothetical protein
MAFTTFPIPSVELATIATEARTAISALENTNAAVNAKIADDTAATTTALGAVVGGGGVLDSGKLVKFNSTGGILPATVNKVIVTAPTTSSTLTIADGKTINAQGDITTSSTGSIDTTSGGSISTGTGNLTGPGQNGSIAITNPATTQTFSGPHSFSTRPLSTASSDPVATSLITRDDLIALVPQWKFPFLAATANVTASGSSISYDGGNVIKTGATDGGAVIIRPWGGGSAPFQYRGGVSGSWAGDRTIAMAFQLNVNTALATGICRIQAGRSAGTITFVDLVAANTAVSLKVENLACKLQVANGTTLATSATLHTLTANTIVDVVISVAGGIATLYINGASVGTLSGAPTTSVNVGGGPGFSASVINTGTAATYDVVIGHTKILVY